ncbi:L-serine dehydratase, iron-sulfur-dependent, alpha subunit [Desulfitobacterium dichloroeliminans LMG P-21439]|uniref:L-serine dehydratase n=1 Tax=Desulfitobacterium dichloroeliminans (strain LMG P-21439 / DCA1) TaxID=871963 RepID=L0FBW7_DESDL|nr:L-serine ammonia-lyase, iron-sulfur-dependent, subunit alpha [Desulfitobacterium dichloroeliminans]AGA70136.1 L-serine dehydratase, iron-sulfur-dependent, alpha subunit [Desulfitobacterium dichloroeliminans LMG P-21439]
MRSTMDYVSLAEQEGKKIGEIVLVEQAEEAEKSRDELSRRMAQSLQVMREAVQSGLTGERKSLSGLVGGEALKVNQWRSSQKSLIGDRMNGAIARALAVVEVNASMGKIVAAPTAGSCGVLPAVLLTAEEALQSSEEEVVTALFCAAGIGMIIADRANVSGAEGGCQAEIGSAAGMAAAAAVELAGGSPAACAHAAAIAMKSFLGLVCDPVAGLVEVPCVKRNATASTVALAAAEMALAGIESAIPLDEVIDAMNEIGKSMPCSLRETAQGGLAITPTGQRIQADFL